MKPPRWATWLLKTFGHPNTMEETEGDLLELYNYWAQTVGVRKANWRYALSALKLLRPLAKRKNDYPITYLYSPTMIQNYFKIALRTLSQNKAYSFINVIGLSIGLAAAMLIMLYTKDEVSYDRFHSKEAQIYRITFKSLTPEGNPEYQTGITGYLQGPKFKNGVPEIMSYVRFKQHSFNLRQGTEVQSQKVFFADPDFFQVFTFPLRNGNPQTALLDPKSVVLSEEMAEKQFGTTDALGKTIFLKDASAQNDQFEPYTVTGVAKKLPQNSTIKFEFLLPLVVSNQTMENPESWLNTSINTFVLLAPNARLKAVEAKMNRVYQADSKEAIQLAAEKYDLKINREYALQPFTDIHLSKELPAENGLLDGSSPTFSYILSGIALFILLIACINFVNLTTARSLRRAKEIGVRKVVGGGRAQLILQFLGESFLLCFAAFLLAFLFIELSLPNFNQLSNKALSLSYLFDIKLILGYILLFLATGLLSGLYPALVLSGFNPIQSLYSRFHFSNKNYLQKSLVVVQFALASFLIIATFTIYSQFNYLIHKPLGYDDKNIIRIDKWDMKRSEAKLLTDELLKSPDIVAVAPKNGDRNSTVAKINGDTQIEFTYETVDAAYLPLLNIPLGQGRNFSADFPTDSTQSVLVNETFVKVAGWQNPIGQPVGFGKNGEEKYIVVGIVKDYHYASLSRQIKPQLFTMKPTNRYGSLLIKINSDKETAGLSYVEATFKKLFPIYPYSYKFLDEENINRYDSEAKWKKIMLFGALLTIFISCIGLFGLATLSAERRVKEIGIRKVMGASVSSIVGLLSSDFIKLVGISFAVAFPAAYFAIDKWLQNYPYCINISVWTFALTALLAILIAFFTISLQSVRAALMNPVKSLKTE